MNYQHITTKEVKAHQEIKRINRNTSYPRAGADMLGEEWKLIVNSPLPSTNEDSEGVREIAPVDYVQTWEVYDLTQAEIDDSKEKKEEKQTNKGWQAYLRAEEQAKKQQWIADGKPIYS